MGKRLTQVTEAIVEDACSVEVTNAGRDESAVSRKDTKKKRTLRGGNVKNTNRGEGGGSETDEIRMRKFTDSVMQRVAGKGRAQEKAPSFENSLRGVGRE